jgi:hypothetical protein
MLGHLWPMHHSMKGDGVSIKTKMLIGFLLTLLGPMLHCAKQELPLSAMQINVDRLLTNSRTQNSISRFVGHGPSRCVKSSTSMIVCAWSVSHRAPGWQLLAAGIETAKSLVLLCELPIDGSERATGSCSAVPKQSHRWSSRNVSLDEREKMAQSRLNDPLTLVEMSRLLGAVPTRCSPASAGNQICYWHTNAGVFVHYTVATSIKGNVHKKFRLICTFPTNGSDRSEGCYAEVDR